MSADVHFWNEAGEALDMWAVAEFVPREGDRVRVWTTGGPVWVEVLKVYWHDHNRVGCNCREVKVTPVGAADA